MDELLTAHQVQDILKVDRITVYRMLHDGRLTGTKIGQQWRFRKAEIEELLLGTRSTGQFHVTADDNNLPIHCLQTIQDLFSSVSEYPAILINMQGIPITIMSRPSAYYRLICDHAEGEKRLNESYKKFVQQARDGESRFLCSTGLHYAGQCISDAAEPVGLFLVGGFKREGVTTNLDLLFSSPKFYLSEELQTAYDSVPLLPYEQEEKVDSWAAATVLAFESILKERSTFSQRLKRIADLTQIS